VAIDPVSRSRYLRCCRALSITRFSNAQRHSRSVLLSFILYNLSFSLFDPRSKINRQRFPILWLNSRLLLTLLSLGSLFALSGCHVERKLYPTSTAAMTYPPYWWTPVPREGAPAWEILPQDAKPGEVILSKRNELGLLSNFAPTPFTFHERRYASLEGFWQMMKFPENEQDPRARFPGLNWPFTREQVAQLSSFEAKRAGTLAEQNMKQMGITWVTFEGKQFEYKPSQPGEHYRLIVEATWAKVLQNPEVRHVLLATGNLVLKPDHHQEPDAPAAWRYYEILMEIRSELQRDPRATTKPYAADAFRAR
jgi:predicted NAD-dependent protein-ADP-ribosyltransferase YbiA (DUF1768 family)